MSKLWPGNALREKNTKNGFKFLDSFECGCTFNVSYTFAAVTVTLVENRWLSYILILHILGVLQVWSLNVSVESFCYIVSTSMVRGEGGMVKSFFFILKKLPRGLKKGDWVLSKSWQTNVAPERSPHSRKTHKNQKQFHDLLPRHRFSWRTTVLISTSCLYLPHGMETENTLRATAVCRISYLFYAPSRAELNEG